jgi:type I restriction enzyme S subunit
MSSKGKLSAVTGGGAALVPRLRFPEFQSAPAWEQVSLRKASIPVYERVGERKLTPVSISAGIGFVRQAEKFGRDISGSQYQLYTLVRDGDFVFNKGNSLKFPQGCIYLLQGWGQVAAPNVFIAFRLRDDYSNGFFQNCFEQNQHGKQLKKHITSGARSNGLLNISKETFFNVKIPAPSLPEQQKIADCLESADALIEAQGRKVEALRAHKKSLIQQLFPQEGETQPRLRFLEFQSAGEWEEHDFADLVLFQEGPGIMAADFHDEGVPLVRLSGLAEGKVSLEGCNYLDPEKVAKKWPHFRLELGDILVSCSASFGRPSLVDDRTAGSVFYTGLIRFRPRGPRLDANYLQVFLSSPCFSQQAEGAAVGGGIKHFGPTHLRQMKIWRPPNIAEQQRVADCLTSLDDLIAAENQKLDTLKTHKNGLMQQLFPQVREDDT